MSSYYLVLSNSKFDLNSWDKNYIYRVVKEFFTSIMQTGTKNECYQCKKEVTAKPWITYTLEPKVHLCSYHCNYIAALSKEHYNKIENKEDFEDLRPILPKKKDKVGFFRKSSFELSLMSDEEYRKYQGAYNEYYSFRPEEHIVHQEIQDNDDYEKMIENECYLSDEEYADDYQV